MTTKKQALRDRIQRALKRETGMRLSAADIQGISASIGIGIIPRRKRSAKTKARRKKQEPIEVNIRWMIRRDMPEVLEIESSFEFPWSEEEFIRCLRQRNCIGMVAEYNEKVAGFMIYELERSEIRVLNFVVHPDLREAGVGRQCVAKLVGKLSKERRNKITLEISEASLAGLEFFKAMRFKAVGVLRNHYEENSDAAIAMEYRYSGPASTFSVKTSKPKVDKSMWEFGDDDDDGDGLVEASD